LPRPHVTMHKIREILRLDHEGLSQRDIAASMAIPKTTVGDYLRRAKVAGVAWPLGDEVDDQVLTDTLFGERPMPGATRPMPDLAHVHRELRRKGVTLLLLWHEYRAEHPDGYAYTQFCEHYRRFVATLHPTMRITHIAGEKTFIDFAGMTLPIWNGTEVAFSAQVFVAALGASNLLYVEALRSQDLASFIGANERAFHYFGGVSQLQVPDNLKSAVTTPDRYEPIPNATYAEFCAHYSTAVLPTRVRKPRDKAKVEVGVQIVERWILAPLRDRHFTSLAEANVAVAELAEQVNNKVMRGLGVSRRELFDKIERECLRPLPPTRYDYATWKKAKVGIDYHVEVRADRHFYSVPSALVRAPVDVRVAERTIQIFHNHRLVASHPRSRHPGFTTDPAHMPESHRRHAEWSPARIEAWAAQTGPKTAELVGTLMADRPHPEHGYRSCLGIISLSKKVGPDRLELACGRALALRAHSYTTVKSIRAKHLEDTPLTAPPLRPHPPHDNVRGADYYQ
jgi:transposase